MSGRPAGLVMLFRLRLQIEHRGKWQQVIKISWVSERAELKWSQLGHVGKRNRRGKK